MTAVSGNPLGVGDTDDRVRDLVHRAHLVEVLTLRAFTFVERGGHRVERALERPDLVCGHLLHAGGEIAGLDPLRGGREIAQRHGDASRGAVGKQGDDADKSKPEKNKDADQRSLRLLDSHSRNENRQQPRVLPLRSDDPEDAVVVGVVCGQIPD